MSRTKLCLAALLMAGIVGGCAAPPPPLKVYWPPPPNEPRLQWITTFSTEDNFPKTGGQVFTETLVGKEFRYGFAKPSGIVSNGKGVVYVADMDVGNVKIVDFNNKTVELLAKMPIFKVPLGLALDHAGRLYVADAGQPAIIVFGPDLKPLFTFGGRDDFDKPTFLAINERLGRIYVSDVVGSRVVVFDLTGKKLFSFGSKGSGPGELFGPQGIAIDVKDRVYVAEQFNARVQVFDGDGKSLSMFGERGDREWQFEGPRGLAFDSRGDLFVADGRKAMVMVLDGEGKPLTYLGGGRTTHQLGFSLPTAISIDQNDRIYITDSMNRRFTVWQYLTPDYLREHPLDPEAMKRIREKAQRLEQQNK